MSIARRRTQKHLRFARQDLNDQEARRVVIFTFDGEGDRGFAHFDRGRSEMAYASVIAARHAAEGDWDA